ncbi:MAG: prepilin-type N-terminal cleavage/methylation domain-containing protein [Magnetococcales bacterium]|nr:prepilin-type N-terminal cleavage/methylation domain-containing protein [Magnetococcales bacterium]MBF0632409.1 prepilin-type N-terminal cleavage/methylation domain-containing protein [Magnetococcales bacterium]
MNIRSQKTPQSGFSLIEIAIVLVIIGLLLGGVMKGQTMVQNSKIKRIATDTQAVQSSMNAYTDTYWQLPGDDLNAATHFAGVGPAAGDGNGIIIGFFNFATGANNPASDETALAWNHLRCAELVKGTCVATGANNDIPRNPVGGVLGIADGRDPAPQAVLGLVKKVVCMSSIPTAFAEAYDTQQDDGIGDTGDIRGSQNTEDGSVAGTAQIYTANQTIHICTGF